MRTRTISATIKMIQSSRLMM